MKRKKDEKYTREGKRHKAHSENITYVQMASQKARRKGTRQRRYFER